MTAGGNLEYVPDYINVSLGSDNAIDVTVHENTVRSKYYELEQLSDEKLNNSYGYCSLHINIHSLPDKYDQLKSLLTGLKDVNIDVDFILLCETFLTDQNKDRFNLPGYTLFTKNRKQKTKGGVAVFVKSNHVTRERPDLGENCEGEFESLFVEVLGKAKNQRFIVGEVYRVPNTSEKLSIQRYEKLLEQLKSSDYNGAIIGTDQNFDLLKLDSHSNTRLLLDKFVTNNMLPTITCPTRITHNSATIIDNLYVSEKEIGHVFSAVLMVDISDHLPILAMTGRKSKKTTSKEPLVFNSRKLTEESLLQIKRDIESSNWDYLNTLSVNGAYNSLVQFISNSLDRHAPEKTITIPRHRIIKEPWMTLGLMKSGQIREKLFKQQIGKPRCDNAHLKFIEYRNLLNKIKKVAKQSYYADLISSYKNNMKKTWGVINSIIRRTNDKSNICEMFQINNKSETEPKLISNGFCQYFAKIGSECSNKIGRPKKTFEHYLRKPQCPNSIYLSPSDPGEIISLLKSFSPKKSTGHDGISMRFLKQIGQELADPLSLLINRSLAEGIVPDLMKTAKIVPVHKGKEAHEFTNYRPISLLPGLSKILEKIVHKRLYKFLSSRKIFYESQYGFRPKHSTQHAITEFISDTLMSFEQGKATLATFLDLSKAFDTIDHKILLTKLHHYGVRGVAHGWFQSYLTNRKQFVKYNGVLSDTLDVTCGVPQGSVLGPLLFILYTNDLPDSLKHLKCILFADDTTLYVSSKNIKQLIDTMNAELTTLSDWFKANKLSLNTSKTNYVIFQKSNSLKTNSNEVNITIDGKQIDRVKSPKFLGVYLDENLTWREHIDYCRKKVRSGIYALNMCTQILSMTNMRMLYFSLVHPYLLYGNLLWGSAYKKDLQPLTVLEKKAVRIVTHAKYNEHSSPLFKKLNIPKLDDLFKIQMGKFIYESKKVLLPAPLRNILTFNHNVHAHNTRQSHDVHFGRVQADIIHRSFLHRCPVNWSGLPGTVKDAPSLPSFLTRIRKLFMATY